MKLSKKNLGEQAFCLELNRVTDKIDTRVLVIAGSYNDSLSSKIYAILKREYSTIMSVVRTSNLQQFQTLNLLDFDYFFAFLKVHRIKAIVISSEILLSYPDYDDGDQWALYIQRLVDVCRQYKVKLSYISILNLFVESGDEYSFIGEINKDQYDKCNKAIYKQLERAKDVLIIKVSCIYGLNEYSNSIDFPQYVCNLAKGTEARDFDNMYLLFPIISDEVAIYLSEHFNEVGCCNLLHEHLRVTLRLWAGTILEKLAVKNMPTKEFSNVQEGYFIEKRQENCIFQLVYKLYPAEYYGNESVAKKRIELGMGLASCIPQEIAARIDCVVPVPNSGLYYAMGLAQSLNLPYVQALIADYGEKRGFQVRNADVRKAIIKSKIQLISELIKGKKIIVVDEAIFTGTTLKVVCKMLREAGAAEIYLGIPAPKCFNQCNFYVQPRRAMLLEYVRESMLEEYFGVDKIIFQGKEAFRKMITVFGGVCMDCFLEGGKNE